jgi:hypothetical protein
VHGLVAQSLAQAELTAHVVAFLRWSDSARHALHATVRRGLSATTYPNCAAQHRHTCTCADRHASASTRATTHLCARTCTPCMQTATLAMGSSPHRRTLHGIHSNACTRIDAAGAAGLHHRCPTPRSRSRLHSAAVDCEVQRCRSLSCVAAPALSLAALLCLTAMLCGGIGSVCILCPPP